MLIQRRKIFNQGCLPNRKKRKKCLSSGKQSTNSEILGG